MLQCQLWDGDESFIEIVYLKEVLQCQMLDIKRLKQRNQELLFQLSNLKFIPETIEEYVRYDFGMIKAEETYYQVLDSIKKFIFL